ncbi:hypothetical protein BJ322DRAFT_1069828 [Thelephora terrestris]|uniref:Uncharacterized protein n=1 Tax=Thelephora terrestris TaxID=56493 RepID=A0A9P6HD94_9AGAM|nr:hypothetical protein BJ322DRAFT_1069828 [Thelephora terrestris]
MASRATRYLAPVFRSGFRSSRTTFRAGSGKRGMSTNSSQSKQSRDMPWLICSGLVFVPTIAWILSSGKGEKHAHPHPKTPKDQGEIAEAVEDVPKEAAPEPDTIEPPPEPVSEDKSPEITPETTAPESAFSDDDGVVISAEEVEESINKAIDADVPKEAKTGEVTEDTSPKPSPAPSESEPVEGSMREATDAIPPPPSEEAS